MSYRESSLVPGLDASIRAVHDSPNCLIINERDAVQHCENLLLNASANRILEIPLYAWLSWIFTMAGIALTDNRGLGTSGVHPQTVLEIFYGMKRRRRMPDFGNLFTFHQTCLSSDLGYKTAVLEFWTEAKRFLPGSRSWWSTDARQVTNREMGLHMKQLNQQAYFGFQQFDGSIAYAFLVIGPYFSLFRYRRPKAMARRALPSRIAPTANTTSATTASAADQSSNQPGQEEPPSKKRRMAGDDAPISSGKTRRREAKFQQSWVDLLNIVGMPEPVYYNEIIAEPSFVRPSGPYYTPQFRKALKIVRQDSDYACQPSWFDLPPGDHDASPQSLEDGRQAIEAARARILGGDQEDDASDDEDVDPFGASARGRTRTAIGDRAAPITNPTYQSAIMTRSQSRASSVGSALQDNNEVEDDDNKDNDGDGLYGDYDHDSENGDGDYNDNDNNDNVDQVDAGTNDKAEKRDEETVEDDLFSGPLSPPPESPPPTSS